MCRIYIIPFLNFGVFSELSHGALFLLEQGFMIHPDPYASMGGGKTIGNFKRFDDTLSSLYKQNDQNFKSHELD